MGHPWEFSECAICGVKIYYQSLPSHDLVGADAWDTGLWLEAAIALRGPCESTCRRKMVDSLSEPLSSRAAIADNDGHLQLLPGGHSISIRDKHRSTDDSNDSSTGHHYYLGVHDSCDLLATRVMQSSMTSPLKCLRHIWLTLDRRCEEADRARGWPSSPLHLAPRIPKKTPKDEEDKRWDWEKLFRQVMARVKSLVYPEEGAVRTWNYREVGLDVPPGFINRRRIWQLLEDMDPKELEFEAMRDPDLTFYDSDLQEFRNYSDLSCSEIGEDGGEWGADSGSQPEWGSPSEFPSWRVPTDIKW
ncbi:hypothetical protein G7Z17_g6007 [Cylindrodendrum hubeiense]|uniref:Uncharacterized protein n=1 Tax=Cylindrodendrum hubeiense TaxID=595255 RepID=A0A9P5LB84_9HYPO|nr:hypothetical protein G7Z17_g6007 [Cylindrodendrum hubeiense]